MGRGSKDQVEGLILWMILSTSFTVVRRSCEKQPSGLGVGKSRGEGLETGSEEHMVFTLVVNCAMRVLWGYCKCEIGVQDDLEWGKVALSCQDYY